MKNVLNVYHIFDAYIIVRRLAYHLAALSPSSSPLLLCLSPFQSTWRKAVTFLVSTAFQIKTIVYFYSRNIQNQQVNGSNLCRPKDDRTGRNSWRAFHLIMKGKYTHGNVLVLEFYFSVRRCLSVKLRFDHHDY